MTIIFLIPNLYSFINTFPKIHNDGHESKPAICILAMIEESQKHLRQGSLTGQVNWGFKSTGGPNRCTPFRLSKVI